MSYERQVPKLFLRGSLVNVTMKDINPQERQLVELTFHNLINDPELEESRIKFVKRFNRTIRADYKDDILNSEQDYNIALWRALVDLLASRKINGFTCRNCGATSYTNRCGDTINFNQCYQISPCCNKIMVGPDFLNPDDCDLQTIENSKSPIMANRGERKYSDEILNNRKELIKFVSRHISNYQQQCIKENQMAKYDTKKTISVPPLFSCAEDLCKSLKDNHINYKAHYMPTNGMAKIPANVYPNNAPNAFYDVLFQEGYGSFELVPISTKYRTIFSVETLATYAALDKPREIHISFDTFACDTDAIVDIMLILQRHSECGIIHDLHDDKIVIISTRDQELVEMTCNVKEKIKFSNHRKEDSDGLDTAIHGGEKKMIGFGDDHETNVEIHEIINKIADNLNDHSKIVWILQVQSSGYSVAGERDRYQEYSERYPGAKLNNTDLADYLGVSTRVIKRCREEIENQSRFHGLG